MKHRPFSELTKDWSPERVAKNEARVATALAALDRQERERPPDEEREREHDAMSDLGTQLHEDARTRFEELGWSLLGSVTTFPAPPTQPRPNFSPNIFTPGRITDADIVGDVHLGWEDSDGKKLGIALAQEGGLRTGLVGPAYEKLEALARSMRKVQPFKSTASMEFLRGQIFEWIKDRHRGHGSAGCVNYVVQALQTEVAQHRLLFPVSELHVQSPLTLGLVTVSTFPERIFEELESKQIDGPSARAHAELCRSMRRDFQGLAVAETSVFGEPIRAQEIASDRVELAIGLLRFFTPPGVTSRVARWGYAPRRTDRVFITDASGKFSSTSGAIIDRPGTMVLSDNLRDILLGVGLAEVCDILAHNSRTDFEKALLKGMVTFGRAALTPDPEEKMVWYCAGLESILLRDSSEPILHNLGERLAMFSYDTVDERTAALKDIKKAYSLRSRFLHHGVDIEEGEIVAGFAHHGLRLFSRIAKAVADFSSKLEFLDHIDRMKLSGASR